MGEDKISPQDFGALFKGFLESAVASTPTEPRFFTKRLQEHFAQDPAKLPTLSESIEKADHPNLHLALESYLARPGLQTELIGIMGEESYRELSIAGLLQPMHGSGAAEGPVKYTNLRLGDGTLLPCVAQALYLLRDGDKRFALLVAVPDGMHNPFMKIRVEIMTADHQDAVRMFGELRTAMRERNVYRGHVVSLGMDQVGNMTVQFKTLRPIARDQIVLPDGMLDRIERQTIGFSQHRESLLAAGRHLKRGMLLFGPPGTGKTLTAMYLATQMKDRSTFLLTGRGLAMIEQSCAMARLLQPSTVILEDVDLVAEERSKNNCTTLLFELLNQMDGLGDDADVVFILTTNRADMLEPALASRPGRIDLAVEVPAPDATCRRRLFELYGNGLTMRVESIESFIARTEGVSAAFIRELLRKAALFAVEASAPAVEDRHLDAALHELVVLGGDLTRSLLGVKARG